VKTTTTYRSRPQAITGPHGDPTIAREPLAISVLMLRIFIAFSLSRFAQLSALLCFLKAPLAGLQVSARLSGLRENDRKPRRDYGPHDLKRLGSRVLGDGVNAVDDRLGFAPRLGAEIFVVWHRAGRGKLFDGLRITRSAD
jgi:hypothetical protein